MVLTSRGRAAALLVALVAATALLTPAAGAQAPGALTVRDRTEPVGPGIELRTLERLLPSGFMQARVLEIDLADGASDAELLYPGRVAAAEPLSETARRENAVAGVNGDFFDINNTRAPQGPMLGEGDFLKAPTDFTDNELAITAGVGADGLGRLGRTLLDGVVELPGGDTVLGALNQSSLSAGEVGLYTPVWGEADRSRVTQSSTNVREVVVRGGTVVSSAPSVSVRAIPRDGFVLVGRDAGADALAGLAPGDEVSVRYRPRTEALTAGDPAPPAFRFGVGGRYVLVRDGEPVALPTNDALVTSRNPRTAVGFSADGRRMWLATVNGRLASVPGLTLPELAVLMDELGADDSLNLDGGGSTTLVARERGEPDAEVRNTPSDGSERPVPNGIGLFAQSAGGLLTGIEVEPRIEDERALRVHAGLTRRLVAEGHDAAAAPAPTPGTSWSADRGSLRGSTYVAPAEAGPATVRATSGAVSGERELRVLGPVVRLSAAPGRVAFADDQAGPVSLTVTGYDAEGYAAPLELDDLRLDYDRAIVDIERGEDGRLRVSPRARGATVVTVGVGSGADAASLRVPMTVGLDTLPVADFEDVAAWRFTHARADNGSISSAPGRTGNGVRVTYDFTESTSTRTSGVVPAAPLELPGQPQTIGVWIDSDGRGAWTSATVRQANGVSTNIYGPYLTQPGWTRVAFRVPAGLAYPLTLSSLRVIETSAARQYAGEVVYDDLTVEAPPSVDVAESEPRRDPIIQRTGALDDGRWRFATLSDIQFTADDTALNRELQDLARQYLRQIRAEDPELLIINGDFVDEGYPEDVALARRIITEELGDAVPWVYVPGNHETYGTRNLNAWRAEFGEDHRVIDVNGMRFVTLNSSLGSLRGSNFAQLGVLRRALDEAAADPAIRGVTVVAHHPVEDPLPSDNSQLADRLEVDMLRGWLSDFRDRTGKRVAMMGSHAQVVDVERLDGVPYIVLPAGGKAAYGTPDRGGFNGRAVFGVDFGAEDWLRAEIRPRAERIELRAPDALTVGEAGEVSADALQPRTGLRVPLRYPATVRWSGSENLFVGPAAGAERARAEGFDALLDPADGRLVGLDAGEVRVRVAVGAATADQPDGVAAERVVRVTRAATPDEPPAGGGGNPAPSPRGEGGTAAPAPAPGAGRGAPSGRAPSAGPPVRLLVRVALARRALRAGRRIDLRFQVAQGGRVRIRVEREVRRRGRTIRVLARELTRLVVAGRHRVSFEHDRRGARLRPGRYRITVTASTAGGRRSTPAVLRVRVLPARRGR